MYTNGGGDFKNEIVWCYASGGVSKTHFSKKHDVIFFYTKSKNYTFNVDEVREEYSSPEKVEFKLVNGKQYIRKNPLGRVPLDWWIIPILTNTAKERLGYPTQKPEELLGKIIKASTNEGDLILDAYCGCGTTVAVAQNLNRNWVGIDITYQSISLILKRIEDSFGKKISDKIILNGVPQDMQSAIALAHKKDDKTRKEFEKWAILTYSNNRAMINEKKGGDGGIDGIARIVDIDDKRQTFFNNVIFSVKSDAKYPPSYIRDLFGVINRHEAVIGIIITLHKADNLIKESKQYGLYKNKMLDKEFSKIQVVSVDEILKGVRMSIPTTQEVVKSAEEKINTSQIGLF